MIFQRILELQDNCKDGQLLEYEFWLHLVVFKIKEMACLGKER